GACLVPASSQLARHDRAGCRPAGGLGLPPCGRRIRLCNLCAADRTPLSEPGLSARHRVRRDGGDHDGAIRHRSSATGETPMIDPTDHPGQARAAGPSPRLILDSINAYQRSAALKAAVTLDVFSAIAAGAATPSALATATRADARALRILCDYLVVAGFLVK